MPRSMRQSSARIDALSLSLAAAAIATVTVAFRQWLSVTSPTTAALTYLLVVLVVATTATLRIAVAASVLADLCLNYFFMPPIGRWTIADPQNVVALFVFLAVSLVASNLSTTARDRTRETVARRDEVTRLFDLSRDVLLLTDTREAIATLARAISRRFDLESVAVCLPRGGRWEMFDGGARSLRPDPSQLSLALAGAERTLEFDARDRTDGGHRTVDVQGETIKLVPLRLGTKPVGLLAAAGRPIEAGTLDALAGLVAMAIERLQFLEERKTAEIARQSEELKTALLASIGHDLRTPLTAIRVAATNLQASWLSETDRQEQGDVVLAEVQRLTRLFQNILDMARIDAGAVPRERRWVHAAEIVEAARDEVAHTMASHPLDTARVGDAVVLIDPRLTAAALAHVLENAIQYSPAGAPVAVEARVTDEGLEIAVTDRGSGIPAADLPHLFDRFYRGDSARQHRASGTGLGLSIARGLLAAEGGRIWAENMPGSGARFTIAVPAERKLASPAEVSS